MKPPDLIRTIEIKDRSGRVIGTKDVVTYPGLLSKAHEEGLSKVETSLLQIPSDENARTAIAKAVVETTKGRFEGIGDATPENVNAFIIPHLIRMAETRAKARALRDAVNIGIVSFEELDGEGYANGADLGSGAPPAGQRSAPKNRGRSEATQPAAPSADTSDGDGSFPPGNGSEPPMSEAQRRYLFRILASRGMKASESHTLIEELAGGVSLKELTKADASGLIDRLLKDPGLGTVRHADREH
jgi:hypothetical protein